MQGFLERIQWIKSVQSLIGEEEDDVVIDSEDVGNSSELTLNTV